MQLGGKDINASNSSNVKKDRNAIHTQKNLSLISLFPKPHD